MGVETESKGPTEPGALLSGRVLARSTVWNLAGGIAPLAVAIVTIPILLRGLGTARFGILTLAWVFIGYFSLFDFGLGRALTQAVAHALGGPDEHELPATIWSGLAVMAVGGLIGGILCLAAIPALLAHTSLVPAQLYGETRIAALIMSATVPLVVVTTGLRGVLEAQQKFGLSNLVRGPLGALTYVAPLAVLPFTTSLAAILGALAVTRVLALIAYMVACLLSTPATHRVRFRVSAVRRLMVFGGWISVVNIVGPITAYVDRFVLAAVMSAAIVAYYTTPFEAVTRILVIPVAAGGVLFPAFATSFRHDRERAVTLLDKGSKYIAVGLFPALLITALFARELLGSWINPEFAALAAPVLGWLSAGVLANGIAQVPYGVVQGSGHPSWAAKLQVIELVLYVPLLVVIVGRGGIAGVALAWTLRASIDYFVVDFMAYRLLRPITRTWRKRLFGPATVILVGATTLFDGPTWEKALIAGPLLAVFASASWFAVLSPVERSFLMSAVRLSPRAQAASPK